MGEAAPHIVHAIAGSVASSCAMALTYPLDQVRTVLQNKAGQRGPDEKKSTTEEIMEVYRQDGLSGFYRGLLPVIQTIGISNFLYFYIFEAFKNRCPPRPLWSLVASCFAGIVNMAITEPFWKTCTRIQSSVRHNGDSKVVVVGESREVSNRSSSLRASVPTSPPFPHSKENTSNKYAHAQAEDSSSNTNNVRSSKEKSTSAPLTPKKPRSGPAARGAVSDRGRLTMEESTPGEGQIKDESNRPAVESKQSGGLAHDNHPSSSSSGSRKRHSQNLAIQTYRLGMEEGWLQLWQGFYTSIWLTSNPVVQFFVYDWIKIIRTRPRHGTEDTIRNLSSTEAFFFGMLAKALATLVTYPLQVAQTQLRARKPGDDATMIRCLETIVRNSGVKGLFQGLLPKLSQASLTAAFMFLFYERILKLIHVTRRRIASG